jgi:hypothetical protein
MLITSPCDSVSVSEGEAQMRDLNRRLEPSWEMDGQQAHSRRVFTLRPSALLEISLFFFTREQYAYKLHIIIFD